MLGSLPLRSRPTNGRIGGNKGRGSIGEGEKASSFDGDAGNTVAERVLVIADGERGRAGRAELVDVSSE